MNCISNVGIRMYYFLLIDTIVKGAFAMQALD
jgi:hypothetical protein